MNDLRQHDQAGPFFAETIAKFCKQFSVPTAEEAAVAAVSWFLCRSIKRLLTRPQRIRKWYYNHAKPSKKPRAPLGVVDFTKSQTQRKVVPLPPAQAYSILYCTSGSDLYKHLRKEWKRYVSADEATVKQYKHLFSAHHNPNMPFVTFQQAFLRDKFPSVTEDERNATIAFIEARFQEENDLRERPWLALKVDENQSDIDLQRQYAKEYVLPSCFVTHH